jgi:hypothetical protein
MTAAFTPPPPAEQLHQLDFLLGTFDCDGRVLATPFSSEQPLKRTLDTRRDLDGHWLFMRIDEAATRERPHPTCGNWQITFDQRRDCFASVWTDNLGRWALQTSNGWTGDTLQFTGDALVAGKPGAVRDTLVRRGADEMLFVVEFHVDGAWARFLESTCKRRQAPR